MNDKPQCAVGIDVGTENVRAVVLEVNGEEPLKVIGYAEVKNSGMRKGVVANLNGPAKGVDDALGVIEKMSGVQINSAYVSVNGSHLVSVRTEGMITILNGKEIDAEDLKRLNDAATMGRIPQNREIISIVPVSYTLDGQDGIRDPIGMSGVRLEMKANVVSGLTPSCAALEKSIRQVDVEVMKEVPTSVAAARAVLTEAQMENGVAVLDLGSSTTSMAIYNEGDLQFVGVLNLGATNITKDIAVGLAADMEMAETIKMKYASADFPEGDQDITVRHGQDETTFTRNDVNAIVKDRLIDIFEHVIKLLKSSGYAQRLPGGVVLVGCGAKLPGITRFAKQALGMPVHIGKPGVGLIGLSDAVEKPEYAAAVGLALMMVDDGVSVTGENGAEEKAPKEKKGFFQRLFRQN